MSFANGARPVGKSALMFSPKSTSRLFFFAFPFCDLGSASAKMEFRVASSSTDAAIFAIVSRFPRKSVFASLRNVLSSSTPRKPRFANAYTPGNLTSDASASGVVKRASTLPTNSPVTSFRSFLNSPFVNPPTLATSLLSRAISSGVNPRPSSPTRTLASIIAHRNARNSADDFDGSFLPLTGQCPIMRLSKRGASCPNNTPPQYRF